MQKHKGKLAALTALFMKLGPSIEKLRSRSKRGFLVKSFSGALLAIALLLAFSLHDHPGALDHEINRRQYERFIREHPYNNRPPMAKADLEKIPKYDRPDLAMQQNFLMTMDPKLKYPPVERLFPVYRQVQAFKRDRLNKKGASALLNVPGDPVLPWVERGPSNVGGRTRALMFDPNDPSKKKVWAGGVAGGLWFTTDITNPNAGWTNVDDFFANLAITTMDFDPNNPQVFYVGTGEGWFNPDAVRGAGIWKTINGGATWTQLPNTTGFNFFYIQKIKVHPVTGHVYAATRNNGIMRSTTGGDTWAQVLGAWAGALTNRAADIEFGADNRIYVSLGMFFDTDGVYRSPTGNAGSWTKLNTRVNGFPNAGIQRIELATAPSDANIIYAVVQGAENGVLGIFRSPDQGKTWNALALPTDADLGIPATDFTRSAAWYNLIAAVDPNDAKVVFVGGIDLFKTTNGDANANVNWKQISKWSNTPNLNQLPVSTVHADQHAIVFKPGSSEEIIFGNDGGVYYTANGTTLSPNIMSRNKGYNVTQFYSCALRPVTGSPPTGNNYFLGGAQDNGSQQFNSPGINETTEVTGGDGGFCFIDQTDPTFQVTSYIRNNFYRSTNGGAFFVNLSSDDTGLFTNPADYDDVLDILYSARRPVSLKRIRGITENPIQDTINVALGATASHIRVSYTTNLFVGTTAGRVFKIINANAVPVPADITGNLPVAGNVSCIEIGENENELLVTYSNYGVVSVWYTNNGGANWFNKEGDLPDMPVRWALFNPNNRNEVILATEVGVWSTANLNAAVPNWQPSNSGLANVRVDMLQIRSSDNTVIAATHGRGLFSSCGFVSNLISLSNRNINAEVTFKSFDSIIAGPAVQIFFPAKVNFIAGTQISLRPEFIAINGSEFHAFISSEVCEETGAAYTASTPLPAGSAPKPAEMVSDLRKEADNALTEALPTEFSLSQNYPNPFNPTTTIKYALKERVRVSLKIYDMLGQQVRTLVDDDQNAGFKEVVWDGKNDFGQPVASGVYLYRMVADSPTGGAGQRYVRVQKMTFMK